jgi:translation initiation factor 2 subunit 1
LSKRRVSAEDIAKCEDRYNKSKTVHSIMRHVSDKTGKDLEELNAMIAWPLYKKYGHAHEAFKIAITDPDAVFDEFDLPADVRSELLANIARRLTPQPVKVRADIELTCFAYSGVLAIQKALEAGGKLQTEAIPIDIRLIAPPLYVLISNATDKAGAIDRLEAAIERIKEVIEEAKGQCVVKLKVRLERLCKRSLLRMFRSRTAQGGIGNGRIGTQCPYGEGGERE